jgi:hypothetical protein
VEKLGRESATMAGKKEPEDDETKPTSPLASVKAKVALAALKGDRTLA